MNAAPLFGWLARLLLSLLVAALLVAWLVSTRIPDAAQRTPTALEPGSDDDRAVAGSQPAPPSEGALYIWRDERGVTQIRSEPPPQSVQPQVVPFERKPARSETPGAEAVTEATPREPKSPLSVYTPEGMEDLMEQVEETARQLDERNQRLEELSKQL